MQRFRWSVEKAPDNTCNCSPCSTHRGHGLETPAASQIEMRSRRAGIQTLADGCRRQKTRHNGVDECACIIEPRPERCAIPGSPDMESRKAPQMMQLVKSFTARRSSFRFARTSHGRQDRCSRRSSNGQANHVFKSITWPRGRTTKRRLLPKRWNGTSRSRPHHSDSVLDSKVSWSHWSKRNPTTGVKSICPINGGTNPRNRFR